MSLQTDFTTKFTEFTATQITDYFLLLEETYPFLYGVLYGTSNNDDQVILYLMAHLMSLQTSGKSGNYATSKSDGDVSISYATPTSLSERYLFYSSTKYGVMFLQLTNKNIGAHFV